MKLKNTEYPACKRFFDIIKRRSNEFSEYFEIVHVAHGKVIRDKKDILYLFKQQAKGLRQGVFDLKIIGKHKLLYIQFTTMERYIELDHCISEEQFDFYEKLWERGIPSLLTSSSYSAFNFVQDHFS